MSRSNRAVRDNRVVDILMKRDGISRGDALSLINEARDEMLETGTDDAMLDILGLEPDYIMDVLL